MEEEIQYSDYCRKAILETMEIANSRRHEYITPEHFLMALLKQSKFIEALKTVDADYFSMARETADYLESLESLPEDEQYFNQPSCQWEEMMSMAADTMYFSSQKKLKLTHVVKAMLELHDSDAAYILRQGIGSREGEFVSALISAYDLSDDINNVLMSEPGNDGELPDNDGGQWKSLVVCMNDHLKNRNPLIGRDAELERTVRVLCRKEKNNPLHLGEPGVGKTALVYGLARLINEGKVPERLKGSRIYALDLSSMLAGTQFRGDFEKKVKTVMDGAAREKGAIIYIDEIHNLVGAGAVGESSMDASNMLKPYLETGDIRFIGSTTYDEYKRHFAKSKGLVRRFQQIDIPEPSVEETVNILRQLKPGYEEFHGVCYLDEAIEYAAKASARHINDRFLPDKAIDLIDEAGAYRELHPSADGSTTVGKELIADILAKVCKVDSLAIKAEDNSRLEDLRERISASIYGQDQAVACVTEAVQMAKAGLTDDSRPLASLLFVGPTGVGKTEVAKVLASQLGIELIRFDMSEYTEKHTVAKLIGSPAGYVGYEDGGLLTDAIRKTPDCVLLLDEIEKAHPDIYNILLQVMDYARLTDNKGNRADFRNVILIMTSNAGAQFAKQASLGFGSNVQAGDAMLRQVKKTFKPEFINRLSATVVFNDMDRTMAGLILDKNLRKLQGMLSAKGVALSLSAQARELLLEEGFSKEYGARELDRVISSRLKPLLMREILFGALKEGGKAEATVENGQLKIITTTER